MDEDDGEHFELAYPFVCTVSNGGQWDDEAFVAGMQLGDLTARMRATEPVIEVPVVPGLLAQIDLAAMHHGYALSVVSSDESWV